MKHLTGLALVALLNAAKRAQTSAGWNSVKPFLTMTPDAVVLLDDEPCASEPELSLAELLTADAHDD